jgi:ABC-2 type transport system permease protein
VSHIVTASRTLANQGTMSPDVGWALLGCFVVIAVFAPLSVRSYKRKM